LFEIIASKFTDSIIFCITNFTYTYYLAHAECHTMAKAKTFCAKPGLSSYYSDNFGIKLFKDLAFTLNDNVLKIDAQWFS
jgi:hypothetical protein